MTMLMMTTMGFFVMSMIMITTMFFMRSRIFRMHRGMGFTALTMMMKFLALPVIVMMHLLNTIMMVGIHFR